MSTGDEEKQLAFDTVLFTVVHGAGWISVAQLAGRSSGLLQCTPGGCLNSRIAPSPSLHLADLQKCGH